MNTFLKYFRLYGSYIALVSVFIFFAPGNFRTFGGIGWQILMFIMFLSPITKLFPRFTWLARIMPLRRQLGIIAGSLVLAHGVGAYLVGYEPYTYLTQPQSYMFWGLLGAFATLPLLLTSNNFAVRKLKKNWKVVQRLSYFMFVFGALHIYLVNPNEYAGVLVMVIIWLALKVLAANKVVIWKK